MFRGHGRRGRRGTLSWDMRCLAALLVGTVMTACSDGPPPGGQERGGVPGSGPAAWTFTEEGAGAGLAGIVRSGTERQEYIVEVKGLGVAVVDADRDGRPDLFFSGGSSVERAVKGEPGFGCQLWRNETPPGGKLAFRDVTAASGVPAGTWSSGPAVADADGDGDPDILVTGFRRVMLLRNRGDGTFEERAAEAGLRSDRWTTGAAFGDLDGDGDLDLYVAAYLRFDLANPPVHGRGLSCLWKGRPVMCGPRGLPAEPDHVFRNDGGGRFTDVTEAWGFAAAPPSYGLGVLISDLDADGRNDVFVANDSCPNFFFRNLGGDRFEECAFDFGLAYSADGAERAGMGVDAADLNGDGFPDIAVTNFSNESNSLFLSRGAGRYIESSSALGIAIPSWANLGWGIGFRDFDRDGRLDLFVSNGHVFPDADRPGTGTSWRQRNQVFRGTAEGRFQDVTDRLGEGLAGAHVGRGAAFGDLDNDGDTDVVVVNLNDRPSLLVNHAPADTAFAGLELRQDGPNPEAIGARATLITGAGRLTLEVRRNHSFQASSDPRLLFGLGREAPVALDVRWPDGVAESFPAPPVSRWSVIRRGTGR